MNIVEKYYMRKASLGMNDEFYQEIEQRDIDIMRKAQVYLLVAPIGTMGVVYILNQLRYEVLMSSNFFYVIKKYQEKMHSKYQRKGAPERQGESNSTKQPESAQENGDLKSLYKEINETKEAAEKTRVEQIET
jgi:hypothetical protein